MRRLVRIAGWTALAVSFLAAAGALLPLQPHYIDAKLTPSFAAVLHFAAANARSGDVRLISTFGPLGFLFYDFYLPETFSWLVALRALLASITCWALAWLGNAAWGSPWGAAALLFACAPLMAVLDVWLLTLPLLAALIELPARAPGPLLRLALGVALGIVALIKVTSTIAVLAVLGPMTLATLLARRTIPLQTVGAAASAAIAWLMAGRNATDLLEYVGYSLLDIVPGYSSAMQLPAPLALVLHGAATSVAIFVAGTAVFWHRWRSAAWPAVVALAAGTFLLFKAGFVRADTHVYITSFGFVVIGALLAAGWARSARRFALAALVIALYAGALWFHSFAALGAPPWYFAPVFAGEALRRVGGAPALLLGNGLAGAHAKRAEELSASLEVPTDGPVDLYSWQQGLLIGAGAAYRPRPVFQSYMAYTPRLARANADFLLGPRAPSWIAFKVEPIDGRLPALDDATSWPILLSNYEVADTRGDFLLLRRAAPKRWRLEKVARTETRTGVAISVPPAGGSPVWARIAVRETFGDAFAKVLLAAPIALVDVVASDSTQSRYRLVAPLAREGFLLSPLVRNTGDFLRLFRAMGGNDVTSLTVHVVPLLSDTGEERVVEVEFLRFVVEPADPTT